MYEGFFSKFFSKKKKVIEEPIKIDHKKLSELSQDIIEDLIPDILEIEGAVSDFQLWKRGFKRYVINFPINYYHWKSDINILLSDLNRLNSILKDDYDLSFFVELSFFVKSEYSKEVVKVEMEKFIHYKDFKNYILSKEDDLDHVRQLSIRFEEKT